LGFLDNLDLIYLFFNKVVRSNLKSFISERKPKPRREGMEGIAKEKGKNGFVVE